MTIMHVLHRLALRYRAGTGVKQLARDLGMNEQVFVNKMNPNTTTHHIYAEEIDGIVSLLDADDVAKYFASQRNMVCIKMFQFGDLSDQALLDLFIDLELEKSQWLDKIKMALEDGRIDLGEFAKIKKEYEEFAAAGAEVMARIESYLEASELRGKERGHK